MLNRIRDFCFSRRTRARREVVRDEGGAQQTSDASKTRTRVIVIQSPVGALVVRIPRSWPTWTTELSS